MTIKTTDQDTSQALAQRPAPIERTPELRDHLRGMWAAVAESWGEHADYTDARHAHETETLLDAAELAPGQRVLELASGAGGLGMAAAARVGPHGQVVISDAPQEMTEIVARRAAERGLRNVITRVFDLEDIEQPDQSFSAVLCRDGLQFVLDPDLAAREIHRVLRVGGRASLSVWGPREANPWLSLVLNAVGAQLGKPVPPPGMPGPFALTDANRLTRILQDAGFTDVQVDEVSVPLRARTFDEWWTRTSGLAGPLTAILRTMPVAAAEELKARLRTDVEPYRTSSGLSFPGLALLAHGRRDR